MTAGSAMGIALVALSVAGCAGRTGSAGPPPRTLEIAGDERGAGFERLWYSGHWAFVRDERDGRYRGGSARSFHPGDAVSFLFRGRGFRVYGVTGPTGGDAVVVIPGKKPQSIAFYSPGKRVHALLYASPRLPSAAHSASLVVAPPPAAHPRRRYVNVDDVEIIDPN
jgi:hypothetical protein